jgi:hypothetical protein
MGLREQAKADARAILEDTSGFAWPVTLTSPLGVATYVNGFTTDIGQTIDPETGQAVAGRRASVSVARAALPALPEAVADASRKPWIATFFDSQGLPGTWKVIEVLPDLALGVVVLLLEVYQRAIIQLAPVGLALPSLTLDGSIAPAVPLDGALSLPAGLQLAGNVTPLPVLVGTLALPSLQLAGAVSPTVGTLAAALVLPSLQLSGAFTMALQGALVLPSLQLSGDFTMALQGSLTLPSLQLSGTLTVSASKMAGWLRLAASQQSGGEWTPSIVDVLNAGSPVVQTDVDRRAAVGASANGLPTMVFDSPGDVHLWPVSPSQTATSKWGLLIWFKPASVGSSQTLYDARNNGSNRRFILQALNATVAGFVYSDNFNARKGVTPNVLSAGVWCCIYIKFDGSLTGDARLAIFIDGVAQTLTYSDGDGVGAVMPSALRAAAGNALLGAASDADSPSTPIANGGQIGPNTIPFLDSLIAAEIAAFQGFEAPT